MKFINDLLKLKKSNNNIKLIHGDITDLKNIDVIVDAANKKLLGGGGVDGAIHYAAGPDLGRECKTLGGCETGEAKIVGAYDLPYKNIIMTVGPIYYEEGWAKSHNYNQAELLSNCYKNSLELAKQYNLTKIAFPAISCGVYGYPIKEATIIAIKTVKEFINLNPNFEVTFVLFDEDVYDCYREELKNE